MPKVIDSRTVFDKTVKIFDDFYNYKAIVNADQYDIVNSYFQGVIKNKQIADNYTVFLFEISQNTGVNVLELLTYIKGLDSKLEMNKTIIYYLNTFKSKSTLYGIGFIPQSNQPVARNIVQ